VGKYQQHRGENIRSNFTHFDKMAQILLCSTEAVQHVLDLSTCDTFIQH
jgi:hypothetical protein